MKNLSDYILKNTRFRSPQLLISVTGGAKNFSIDNKTKNAFMRGLVKAAKTTDSWIISGGTNVGVIKNIIFHEDYDKYINVFCRDNSNSIIDIEETILLALKKGDKNNWQSKIRDHSINCIISIVSYEKLKIDVSKKINFEMHRFIPSCFNHFIIFYVLLVTFCKTP